MNKIIHLLISLGCLIATIECRQINQVGLDLVKGFEGWRPNFYKDAAGIKTIGYGHACHVGNKCADIHPPISIAKGEELLRGDLRVSEDCVARVVHVPLNDDQFAALVSFTFNLGCGSLSSSSLLHLLNAHNYRGASLEFGKWVHAGGKRLEGLVRRREAERKLFCAMGGC